MATLAQDESRKTSVRVKCGQQISMEKGVIYGNGNVLGYDRDGDQYVVNPEQAETVRCIFNWYAGGMGLKKIKWELERRGMRTAMRKDKWCFRSISRILRNPLYIGVLTYHREYTPDYLEQKKVVNHGEIPILQVQGGHEHIIPDELFYMVQERLEKKRKIWQGEIGKVGADERGSRERKNHKKTGYLFEEESGTAVHKEEQWDGSGFVKYKEIVFTKEDAKKYLYSIDNRRRIIKWDDINIRIFV